VFTLEQKRFLIKSYFRNGLKVNGSWIYSVQNCLEELHNPEFPNVIVDRKTLEDNLSRCVNLFHETEGVYRRKTTGWPLKRTPSVIETAREIMQNAPSPHFNTSVIATQQTGPCVGK
jgi:uncharacterized protein involved in tolerance to divalent cations